jgi:hypothetical protein
MACESREAAKFSINFVLQKMDEELRSIRADKLKGVYCTKSTYSSMLVPPIMQHYSHDNYPVSVPEYEINEPMPAAIDSYALDKCKGP